VRISVRDCAIGITLATFKFEATTLSNRFEIKLSQIDDVMVDLDRMNADALQSFLEVVASFKQIAEAVAGKDDLSFAIRAGSALCLLDAPAHQLEQIYREMDLAIEGNSDNKEVTDSLRRIQQQIKREGLGYEFQYHQGFEAISLHTRIRSARKIGLKRRGAAKNLKIGLFVGTIKQIGGDHPNYHLDCGDGDKKTIACTVEDAVHVKRFLYETINALIGIKTFSQEGKKDEYTHRSLVEAGQVSAIREFVERYNAYDEIVEGLGYIHIFMEEQLENLQRGLSVLRSLLLAFNDQRFHLSEIKTLLVISKPFAERAEVQAERAALWETYHRKRN
jgi:hypothetical protein